MSLPCYAGGSKNARQVLLNLFFSYIYHMNVVYTAGANKCACQSEPAMVFARAGGWFYGGVEDCGGQCASFFDTPFKHGCFFNATGWAAQNDCVLSYDSKTTPTGLTAIYESVSGQIIVKADFSKQLDLFHLLR